MNSIKENLKVKQYLDSVCLEIKNKKVHKEIRIELRDHIEELRDEYVKSGYSEDDSINKALSVMGNSNIIGQNLNKIHMVKNDKALLIGTSLLACFGVFLMYYIQMTSALGENGVYNLFYKSLIYAVISLGIFFVFKNFDYRYIKKHSKKIYILALIISAYGFIVEHNSGYIEIYNIAVNILILTLYMFLVSLAGIYDSFNWKSKINIAKGIILAVIPVLIYIVSNNKANVIIYTLSVCVILIVSGFKKRYILILFSIAGTAFFSILKNNYYMRYRFLDFFMSFKGVDTLGEYKNIANLINQSNFFGHLNEFNSSMLSDIHTDLIFTYIIYTFGWILGIVLIAIIMFLIIKMILICKKSKNRYGKILISGICSMFTVQCSLSILMNLKIIPIIGVSLPFLSFGGTNIFINVLIIAVVNSVYKLRNISCECIL